MARTKAEMRAQMTAASARAFAHGRKRKQRASTKRLVRDATKEAWDILSKPDCAYRPRSRTGGAPAVPRASPRNNPDPSTSCATASSAVAALARIAEEPQFADL